MQLFEYGGSANQKWILQSATNALTAVRMSDIAGTSNDLFRIVNTMAENLSATPFVALVDSSASDVWKLMQSSGIFIINGHGSKESIGCGGGTELTKEFVKAQPAGSLSGCKLVIYRSCLTARGGEYADNLSSATQGRGARTVVGFQESINTLQANTWLEGFRIYIASGYSVQDACKLATDYTNSNHEGKLGYTDTWVVCGDKTQRLK